ncbi:hypothetical protein HanPI659440_Chr03g0096691 [Helianthus annuus]|nr:hypothetical protein HanPI659440_Chr03g0096691 [Helianthus annuus]
MLSSIPRGGGYQGGDRWRNAGDIGDKERDWPRSNSRILFIFLSTHEYIIQNLAMHIMKILRLHDCIYNFI